MDGVPRDDFCPQERLIPIQIVLKLSFFVFAQYLKIGAMHSVRDMSISNDLIVSGVHRPYRAHFLPNFIERIPFFTLISGRTNFRVRMTPFFLRLIF
jgi:hypothetical protein